MKSKQDTAKSLTYLRKCSMRLPTAEFESAIYRVYKKKLNKSEFAPRLYKALQCTKFFIETDCLGTNNVV